MKDDLEKFKQEIKEKTDLIPQVFLEPSFKAMLELLNSSRVLINIPAYNIQNHPATLIKKEPNGFDLDIAGIFFDFESIDIEILIADRIHQIRNAHVSMKSTSASRQTLDEPLRGQMIFRIAIFEFDTGNSDKSSFRRFIIGKKSTDLLYYIKPQAYRDESKIYLFGKTALKISEYGLSLYEKEYNGKCYFVVDSEQQMPLEIFSDCCFSIMLGFGFISANLYQSECFYLSSTTSDFKITDEIYYKQLRPSILTFGVFNPIYSNPYAYAKAEDVKAELGKSLEVFDADLFSKLCTKAFKNQDYAALLLLIIEANGASLILRPAGYSVALEKITNIIAEENDGLKPIKDKNLAKEVVSKLKEELNLYEERIKQEGTSDSIEILKKKLDNINTPTNRDKLTKPFMIYKIDLSKEEIYAIENRNNFLHGVSIKAKNDSEEYKEVWHISIRLNKIVNKLILKHLGFSGHIINHLKHNEKSFDFPINEKLFEKI